MITVIAGIGAALAVDAVLAADTRRAMKRADLTLDFVSRVTLVPPQRLSDQLNGKTPFTSFWRFFVGEMRDTDFAREFYAIQLDRLDQVPIPKQLGQLVDGVERLIGIRVVMAKADLPHATRPGTVALPLGQKAVS